MLACLPSADSLLRNSTAACRSVKGWNSRFRIFDQIFQMCQIKNSEQHTVLPLTRNLATDTRRKNDKLLHQNLQNILLRKPQTPAPVVVQNQCHVMSLAEVQKVAPTRWIPPMGGSGSLGFATRVRGFGGSYYLVSGAPVKNASQVWGVGLGCLVIYGSPKAPVRDPQPWALCAS